MKPYAPLLAAGIVLILDEDRSEHARGVILWCLIALLAVTVVLHWDATVQAGGQLLDALTFHRGSATSGVGEGG